MINDNHHCTPATILRKNTSVQQYHPHRFPMMLLITQHGRGSQGLSNGSRSIEIGWVLGSNSNTNVRGFASRWRFPASLSLLFGTIDINLPPTPHHTIHHYHTLTKHQYPHHHHQHEPVETKRMINDNHMP